MTSDEVPASVRRSFRLSEVPARALDGGIVTPFVVGDIVVKPAGDPAVDTWCQQVLATTSDDGFVCPRPIQADDGRWVVDGWTATEYHDGLRPLLDDPETVVSVGRRFAAAVNRSPALANLGHLHRSPVAARTDRWARAYRHAWGHERCSVVPEAETIVATLRAVWGSDPTEYPVPEPQVFHCDLTGNVLADRTGRPVVVDFTPAIGPVEFGTAVVAADHLLWHGGQPQLIDRIGADPRLVARALAFRLVAEQLALNVGQTPRHGAKLDDHRRVLRSLDWL